MSLDLTYLHHCDRMACADLGMCEVGELYPLPVTPEHVKSSVVAQSGRLFFI